MTRHMTANREDRINQQGDLLTDTLSSSLRGDRVLMEHPFFSIQKQPLREALVYKDDRVMIRVSPGEKGIATIWDKDILLYLISVVNGKLDRGEAVSRTINLVVHDLLRNIRRSTGQTAYQEIQDALFRLRSTTITTDISSGGRTENRGFGWIDSYRILTHDTVSRKVMTGIEIVLNDWTFRGIVKDRRVLAVNPAYFDLSKGLERRLYEIARKHVGHQEQWKISLVNLAKRCGSLERSLRQFKFQVKTIIADDKIPDYRMTLVGDHASQANKDVTKALGLKPTAKTQRSPNEAIVVIFQPREALQGIGATIPAS